MRAIVAHLIGYIALGITLRISEGGLLGFKQTQDFNMLQKLL